MESPSSDALANPFRGVRTDGRRKADKPFALSATHPSRPKAVAEKHKLLGEAAVALFGYIATHNLCFLRV